MSIEMFEHMRNWQALLGRVAGWLSPRGGNRWGVSHYLLEPRR